MIKDNKFNKNSRVSVRPASDLCPLSSVLCHLTSVTCFLSECARRLDTVVLSPPTGRLIRVTGMVMEAVGLVCSVGSVCQLQLPDGQNVEAEVLGFVDDKIYLMPLSTVYGLSPGCAVTLSMIYPPLRYQKTEAGCQQKANESSCLNNDVRYVPVGTHLLGRVLDALGRPLDGAGALFAESYFPLYRSPVNPLARAQVTAALDVGVRAINGLLTVGRGQRLGLFAGSGVGKSVLLGMMARYTQADVVVVGLIGERGREVKDFIENILGVAGRRRAVVVAAPADTSALMRLHGAAYATVLAEYFRAQGLAVLLLLDSVTRFAQAQREIALAIGEPPVTKGYPPSVFARLPQLIERAGNATSGGGSVTAFYTVLTEGDDPQDPIADAARAILDGHIVLARELSDAGHYPAIDIEQSISRVMVDMVSAEHLAAARRFKQLYSRLQRNRDLISVGAYVTGNDALMDEALRRETAMMRFLTQPMDEAHDLFSSVVALEAVLN